MNKFLPRPIPIEVHSEIEHANGLFPHRQNAENITVLPSLDLCSSKAAFIIVIIPEEY